jgi:hypothetical protein
MGPLRPKKSPWARGDDKSGETKPICRLTIAAAVSHRPLFLVLWRVAFRQNNRGTPAGQFLIGTLPVFWRLCSVFYDIYYWLETDLYIIILSYGDVREVRRRGCRWVAWNGLDRNGGIVIAVDRSSCARIIAWGSACGRFAGQVSVPSTRQT